MRIANPLIRWTGYQFVTIFIGHWSLGEDGKPTRKEFPYGHRLVSRGYWEGLPDDATAMDRLRNKARADGGL